MKAYENNPHNYKKTICWDCANAVPNLDGTRGCRWSREGKPVDGWDAERVDLKVFHNRFIESYYVRECPEFIEG